MEPLRPWIDRELKVFLQGGPRPMTEWMRQAVSVLQLEVPINRNKMRLLNAIVFMSKVSPMPPCHGCR